MSTTDLHELEGETTEIEVGSLLTIETSRGIFPVVVDEMTPAGDIWAIDQDGAEYELTVDSACILSVANWGSQPF